MATYKTKGIIIRRKNFGETDRLLTIYTKEYGKIRVVAKGVRKTLSKLGGHLELFYQVNLMLAEGKNLDIITGVEVINNFKNIRGDKYLINNAYYISEIIDLAVHEESEIPEIYELLIEILSSFDKNDSTLSYFELKLVSILGHVPEIFSCVVCKKELSYNHHRFSYAKGGIICQKCANLEINKISPETIKIMRLIIGKNLQFIKKIKIDTNILQELRLVNREMLDYIIEKDINSRRFLYATRIS